MNGTAPAILIIVEMTHVHAHARVLKYESEGFVILALWEYLRTRGRRVLARLTWPTSESMLELIVAKPAVV